MPLARPGRDRRSGGDALGLAARAALLDGVVVRTAVRQRSNGLDQVDPRRPVPAHAAAQPAAGRGKGEGSVRPPRSGEPRRSPGSSPAGRPHDRDAGRPVPVDGRVVQPRRRPRPAEHDARVSGRRGTLARGREPRWWSWIPRATSAGSSCGARSSSTDEGALEHLDEITRLYMGTGPYFARAVPAELAADEHPVRVRLIPTAVPPGRSSSPAAGARPILCPSGGTGSGCARTSRRSGTIMLLRADRSRDGSTPPRGRWQRRRLVTPGGQASESTSFRLGAGPRRGRTMEERDGHPWPGIGPQT